MNRQNKKVMCTGFASGKTHDFQLFKTPKVHFKDDTTAKTDSGYLGIRQLHGNSELPKKKSKKHPLAKEDKRANRRLSSERVLNEHVIGALKRFRIIADRYRNRRKRFGLRFNLIAGIYNLQCG